MTILLPEESSGGVVGKNMCEGLGKLSKDDQLYLGLMCSLHVQDRNWDDLLVFSRPL